jgi:hypothetical protein
MLAVTTNTLLLALALAPATGGGTVVQTGPLPGTGTGQFLDFQLNQFDPLGGTRALDSVTVELFTSVSGGGTTNTSGVPTTITARLTADVLLGGQPLVETEALIDTVIPNNGPVISFSVFDTDSGQTVLTAPAELAPWIGAGSITLTSFTDLFVDEQPANSVFFGAGGGSNYTVTYTYSDVFTSYCTAGTSASGCQATLSATGTPSATASSGFDLIAANVEGQKNGIFFFGANGRQASPWGNGTSFQCVVPPVRRAGTLLGTGTSGACDGAFAQDLNARWCPTCPKPGHNPGAGTVVQAQLWYRDPLNTGNQTTSLSDAIEFQVCP